MTHSKSQIKELLEAHDLHLRRDLGQNFMIDANTSRRIAALAEVTSTDNVLEIGPGLGSLTLTLHEYRPRIVAIEYDRGMVAALRNVVADTDNISVIEADAMNIDWHAVVETDDWVLVANLPYNIATPLVCDLLDEVPQISRMLILVQDEAADRFVASEGSKQYGAVSIKVAHYALAKKVAHIPRTVFMPQPNVESALVDIRRKDTVAEVNVDTMFSLVRTAFGQRRKMLRRSLSAAVNPEQFASAHIDSARRPETLSLDEWYALTKAVSA
ncbi:MAG: 16S rRNA (adenine(1518)-N(6)/adenine(1519)-N(6))-dimethyltransferase RsmA [Ilumatobacteraceae bacterium]